MQPGVEVSVLTVPALTEPVAAEVRELAAAIAGYEKFLAEKDLLLKKKISNWRERVLEMLRESLLQRLLAERLNEAELSRLAAEVAGHHRDPYSAVEEIVASFTSAELESRNK